MSYRLVWHQDRPHLDHVLWKSYDTPWGCLILWVWQDALIRLFRDGDAHARVSFTTHTTSFHKSDAPDSFLEALYSNISAAKKALVLGPSFYQRVWRALVQHGDDTNLTYKALATLAGSSQSYRAVGQALSRNPLPLIIPCHRVISCSGQGGFQWGLTYKKHLQNHPPRIPLENF